MGPVLTRFPGNVKSAITICRPPIETDDLIQ